MTAEFARYGINFMHIHPEITKFLVGVAREEGASMAFLKLNEMMEMVTDQSPNLTNDQATQQVVRLCKSMNANA